MKLRGGKGDKKTGPNVVNLDEKSYRSKLMGEGSD
jgi:hypothetical protein